MTKRFSFFTCCCLLLTLGSHAQLLRRALMAKRLSQNAQSNSNQLPGKAPDYNNMTYWAAHPDKKDNSDSIPAFAHDVVGDKLVDVFFLYPTSYTKDFATAAPNADVDNQDLNNETDSRTILYQSSVFNGVARIYAPRYRQAHLKEFFKRDSEESKKAFDLAYSDLRRAFQYYLDHYNNGRPIIIASHSQGTLHAIRLLQEFFDGKPLQKRLVCAYLIGYHIPTDAFKTIPIGNKPTATGCFVGWRSFKRGFIERDVAAENGNSQCVNPITWTTQPTPATTQQHAGMMVKDFNQLYPHCVSAQIDAASKVLFVDVPPAMEEKLGKLNNYHILDYSLFYMDIRNNVRQRVNAYLAQAH